MGNAIKDYPSAVIAAPYLQILQPERFYTQFFIDRAALKRLNTIAEQSDFEHFGVYFGLEDPETQEFLSEGAAVFAPFNEEALVAAYE